MKTVFFRSHAPANRYNVVPSCYGQPGSSWVPQSYPALQDLGIFVYLDESNHVGINDQPFYYANMFNVTKMRSNVVRMELSGADNLTQAQTKFNVAVERLRKQGGGTISIYYHPCEFIHTEFWDGVNFKRGANPPRKQWKLPGIKPVAEMEKGYSDFEQYVKFIKGKPGVQYVTASELKNLYSSIQKPRKITDDELLALARAMQKEISFYQFEDASLSAADILGVLKFAILKPEFEKGAALFAQTGSKMPELSTGMGFSQYGPARAYQAVPGSKPLTQISLAELRVVSFENVNTHNFGQKWNHHAMPSEIWFGANSLSPQDYLATIAGAVEHHLTTGQWLDPVPVRKGVLGFEKYVAEDSTKLWGWVIFPEGFHAPKIMELARLQAWTLKPALLKRR